MSDQHHMSGPELAKVFGLDIRRITQMAKSGIIPRTERGVYDLKECATAYITYLRNRGAIEEATDPDALDPRRERARLYKAQADERELKNAIERKEYVNIQDVRKFEIERATIYNAQIDAIPGRYASTIAAKLGVDSAQVYDILLDISLQIRESTANGFTSLATGSGSEPDLEATSET